MTKLRCSKCTAHRGIRASPRAVWQCTAQSAGACWAMSKPLYAALVSLPFCYHNDPHIHETVRAVWNYIILVKRRKSFFWSCICRGDKTSELHLLQCDHAVLPDMLLSLRFFCNSLSFSPSASHSPPKNQLFLLSSYFSAGDVTSGLSPMQFRKCSVGILFVNTCIAILFLLIPFRLSWKNEKIQPRHYV